MESVELMSSMPGVTLMQGDCVKVMHEMPEASVDAVVTDPPYGIRFMGKAWDAPDIHSVNNNEQRTRNERGEVAPNPGTTHVSSVTIGSPAAAAGKYDLSLSANQKYQDWCEEWARECLRVLKPGGYLLASGGTRTVHRLTCAIEDAGFEIRDSITWIYASGFPKSLDVSKAIDKQGGNGHLATPIARALKEARSSRGISITQADKMFCGGTTNYSWFEGRPAGQRIPSAETFNHICKEWPELQPFADEVEEAEREVVGKYRKPDGSSPGNGNNAWVKELGEREYNLTTPATEAAKQWEGFGTALKPAHETIVVARKPLSEKTVARNVLEHGTGALNIDESRIGHREERALRRGATTGNGMGYHGSAPQDVVEGGKGRWPANVILSHSPECRQVGVKRVRGSRIEKPCDYQGDAGFFGNSGDRPARGIGDPDGFETTEAWECVMGCPVAELDRQSGSKPPNYRKSRTTDPQGVTWGLNRTDGRSFGHHDQGGASRFFLNLDGELGFKYQAKASRSERNAFTKSLPRTRNKRKRYQQDKSGRWYKRVACDHPTVKPLALMRYLVKLVTPPGGVVLDPFAGSGSTLVAAIQEGFEAVGIEREQEYLEIAERRVAHARAEIESQPLALEV